MKIVDVLSTIGVILDLFLKSKFGNGKAYANTAAANWAAYSPKNANPAVKRTEVYYCNKR